MLHRNVFIKLFFLVFCLDASGRSARPHLQWPWSSKETTLQIKFTETWKITVNKYCSCMRLTGSLRILFTGDGCHIILCYIVQFIEFKYIRLVLLKLHVINIAFKCISSYFICEFSIASNSNCFHWKELQEHEKWDVLCERKKNTPFQQEKKVVGQSKHTFL